MYDEYVSNVPLSLSREKLDRTVAAVMVKVYGWMFLGLLATAVTALVVLIYPPLTTLIFGNPMIFYGLMLGELALVFGLSAAINKISVAAACGWFLFYAILNGLTMAWIFMIYTAGSAAITFVAAASLFGAMSIIGYTTKIDLSRMGGFLLMGLIGLIVASVINIFLANSTLDWILTYAGIFLFLGLTVYDVQRIRKNAAAALLQGGEQREIIRKLAVMGALSLYLNFINLFIRLLRIMGKRR